MKTAIIAVSRKGLRLAHGLTELYPEAEIYAPPRFLKEVRALSCRGEREAALLFFAGRETQRGARDFSCRGNKGGEECFGSTAIIPLSTPFRTALKPLFSTCRLIIFISAAGVAVRTVAPHLRGKDKDPAVVVVDDLGRFAVSLLSGHLGGANEEARKIADFLGAHPVITTATDGRGLTAFDDLARRLGWKVENLPALKEISAAMLETREVFFYSQRPFRYPLRGPIRVVEQLEELEQAKNGFIVVSSRLKEKLPLPEYPHFILRPASIAAGVGCRRGVPAETIVAGVEKAFAEAGLSLASLACLASGEFKAGEKGLVEAAAALGVPLGIYPRAGIAAALGGSACSSFVAQQVGVGAVAEPCARLASGGGEIVLPVRRANGVTVALAERLVYF